jgi:hypothetical protein
MKGADFVWDKEKLDRFIAKPDEVVPGNNMKPRCGVEEPDHWHSRYLRPRRERPTDRRAAEQRDEPDAARRALDRV